MESDIVDAGKVVAEGMGNHPGVQAAEVVLRAKGRCGRGGL